MILGSQCAGCPGVDWGGFWLASREGVMTASPDVAVRPALLLGAGQLGGKPARGPGPEPGAHHTGGTACPCPCTPGWAFPRARGSRKAAPRRVHPASWLRAGEEVPCCRSGAWSPACLGGQHAQEWGSFGATAITRRGPTVLSRPRTPCTFPVLSGQQSNLHPAPPRPPPAPGPLFRVPTPCDRARHGASGAGTVLPRALVSLGPPDRHRLGV